MTTKLDMTKPEWADRFWSKVSVCAEDQCWEWRAHREKKGYGRFQHSGTSHRAHRLSYELVKGPVGKGVFVCHDCDNRGCVNPFHLWLGTIQDNIADMKAKGRARTCAPDKHWTRLRPDCVSRGEDSPRAVLTETQVKKIRRAYENGKTQRALAKQYGVSQYAVYSVLKNLTWRHVP